MTKLKIEVKWAIIFTVVSLLWMVFEKAMGWHDELIASHPIYTNLFAILAIVVYVFAIRDKREKFYHGKMSWKEGFMSGLILSLIVALLSPLAQWITHEIISPDYFANAIAYSVESGNATQQEAEDYFNMTSYLIQGPIFALIVGAITSAIVSIFIKKS